MNLGSSLEVSRGNKGKFVLCPEQLQSNVNRYPVKAPKQTLSFRYGFTTATLAHSGFQQGLVEDAGTCQNSV